MSDINKEIEILAKNMEAATATPKTLEEVISEAGPDAIKKAWPTLSPAQQELLKSTMEDMKKGGQGSGRKPGFSHNGVEVKHNPEDREFYWKSPNGEPSVAKDHAPMEKIKQKIDQEKASHASFMAGNMKKSDDDSDEDNDDKEDAKEILFDMESKQHKTKNPKKLVEAEKKEHMDKAGKTLEPEVDSTINGEQEKNEKKPYQAKSDEKAAKKAKNENMEEQRNQGGVPVEGWEGQVIKGSEMEVSKKEDSQVEPPKQMKQEMSGESQPADAAVPAPQSKDAKPQKVKTPMSGEAENIKKSLVAVITRMQERKLEKSKCIAALAKSSGAPEARVSEIWDMLSKAEQKQDDQPKSKEQDQVEPPKQMKDDKKEKEAPESGKPEAKADEGIKKSDSFYHEETPVYKGNEDVFRNNRFGKNTHFDVDSYIETEEAATKANLKKSTFLYPESTEMKKSSGVNEAVAGTYEKGAPENTTPAQPRDAFLVKSFSDADMDAQFTSQSMWKSEDEDKPEDKKKEKSKDEPEKEEEDKEDSELGKSSTTLEKAEGSKGGKVIGHTKSGKPIYDSASHPKHQGFSQADHKDASRLHSQLSDKADDKAGIMGSPEGDKHFVEAQAHKESARQKRRSNLPQAGDYKDMGSSGHWDSMQDHDKRSKEAMHPAEKKYHAHMSEFHEHMRMAKVRDEKNAGPYARIMSSEHRGNMRKESSEHKKKAMEHFKAAAQSIKGEVPTDMNPNPKKKPFDVIDGGKKEEKK